MHPTPGEPHMTIWDKRSRIRPLKCSWAVQKCYGPHMRFTPHTCSRCWRNNLKAGGPSGPCSGCMLEQAPAASAPMCFLRVARYSREDLALGGGLQPKLDFGQARRGVGRRTHRLHFSPQKCSFRYVRTIESFGSGPAAWGRNPMYYYGWFEPTWLAPFSPCGAFGPLSGRLCRRAK